MSSKKLWLGLGSMVALMILIIMLASAADQSNSEAMGEVMTPIPTRPPGSPTEALIKGHATIWVTNDGGKSWQHRYTSRFDSQIGSTGAEYFLNFFCSSVTTCFIADERQGISVMLSTNDGGNSWQIDTNNNEANKQKEKGIECFDKIDCFRVSYTRIDFSSNNGKTWQQQYFEKGGKYAFTDISCATVSVCVVGGDGGTVITTNDGGQTWIHQPVTGITENIVRISCPSVTTCYAYAHTDVKRFGI